MSYRYPTVTYGIQQTPTEQPSPVTRTVRTNFIQASLDNYTQPPGQDPESMEVLSNIQPITSGVLQRRFGYSFWMNPTQTASHMYDYLSDLTGKREVVLSSPSYVRAQNDDGSDYNVDLFTPSIASAPRAVMSRSYSYFSNGQSPDYKKWDGSSVSGVSKWGININDIGSGVVAGPNPATLATDVGTGAPSGSIGPNSPTSVTSVDFGSGGLPWTSPSDAETLNGVYASVLVSGGGTAGGPESQLLQATGYGLTVPSTAVIRGVVAEVWFSETPFQLENIDSTVRLVVGGVAAGLSRAQMTQPVFPYGYRVYGSSSDTWGLSLTPTQLNASNFGLAFATQNITTDGFDEDGNDVGGAGSDFSYVDHMRVTVYYDMPATVASWTNPSAILVEDGVSATAAVTTAITSALQGTEFGFAVSSTDSVQGIQVDVKASADSPVQLRVQLLKAGVLYGELKSHSIMNASLTFSSYGDSTNLWSGVWTPADINNANFGLSITAIDMFGTANLSVDFVRITVFLSTGPLSLSSPVGGNITLVSGRVYFVSFSNSQSVHYSDLNTPSASTGVLTNQNQPLTNVPVSVDTQVDTVNLLATADGGDETRLYLVASFPNGTTTYTDSMDELTLLAQPVLLSTDATGQEFGVSNNAPPPSGSLYPTKHRGRLYLLNGPTLYWSKSLTEVTTDTSYIAGRWEESWDPNNSTDISEGAESGRGMLSDGVNLYIGTEYKIRRLNGGAPFLEDPDIVHNEVGILNQDVWQITYLEGTPVGAMWLTPDLRVISSDFNTYKDVSTTIQGTLATVNTEVARQTAYASFYANGPLDLYLLALPTQSSTVNDTLCVFNMKTQTWVTWALTDTIASLLYHELSTGVPQLLLAANTGKVYQLTPGATQDRVNDTPVPFTSVARTSWLDMTDGAMRKYLNEIEIQTSDPTLTVTIEGASTVADFQTPRLVATRVVQLSPRGEYKVYLAGATTRDRYYRFTFTSTSTANIVLAGYNIESVEVNRQ